MLACRKALAGRMPGKDQAIVETVVLIGLDGTVKIALGGMRLHLHKAVTPLTGFMTGRLMPACVPPSSEMRCQILRKVLGYAVRRQGGETFRIDVERG